MKKVYSLLTLFCIITFFSCSKDETILDTQEPEEVLKTPEMRTEEISDLTIFSVYLKGKVIDNRESEVTQTGILIGLSTDLTIENNLFKIELDADSNNEFGGEFPFIDIPENTELFIKSYGINSDGVGYGNEIRFTTKTNKVYDGSIVLLTQNEVNSFGQNKYNTITGTIDIGGSVTDLTPLQDLYVIKLRLEIKGTNLNNLNGLNNLIAVGFHEVVWGHGIRIENNQNLTSLQGLNSLKHSRGNFYIINNNNIESVEGLNNYISSEGYLGIYDCDKLENLSGLSKVEYIYELYIHSNQSLKNISAFSNNLTNISEWVYIVNNDLLENLIGLNNLKELYGIIIEGNNSLINLEGLENLISTENLGIKHNDNLANFCALKPLFSNGNYNGVEINYNLENPSINEIISNCN